MALDEKPNVREDWECVDSARCQSVCMEDYEDESSLV